jgi:peptidoglycan/LPS O-acetylase OafA/YrhL
MSHGAPIPATVEPGRRAGNNFNLLRLSAAVLVIISHAFELPTGLARHDEMFYFTGRALAWYAVNVFFVVSGYLIAASWDRRPSLGPFLWARFLRIYPGLFVMLILIVPALGIFFSTLPPLQYLANNQTFLYLAGGLSIVHVQYELPGVFENTPLSAVNGSLWTLRYEVLCYAGIALAGVIGLLRSTGPRRLLLVAVIIASSVVLICFDARGLPQLGGKLAMLYELARLAMCFSLGALYLGMEKDIPLKIYILAPLLAVMIAARGTPLFAPLANIATAYGTMWLAFVPAAKWITWTRSAPDYSYGIYIYAFPIQQALIAAIPGISPAANFAFALAFVIVLAAMSWHFVEKPALSYKSLFSGSRAIRPMPVAE